MKVIVNAFLTLLLLSYMHQVIAQGGEPTWVVNFRKSSTDEFIRFVSRATEYEVLYDENFDLGKVNVSTQRPINKNDLIRLLADMLYAKGFEIEKRTPNSFVIIPKTEQSKILDRLEKTVVITVLINISVFGFLLFFARWSTKCFYLLSHPVVSKAGLYFDFVISNSVYCQLWLFERYYRSLKLFIESEVKTKYVDMKLECPDGHSGVSSQLVSIHKKNPSLWVQGVSGTGKSEALKHLIFEYTREKGLFGAWRKYKYIPIYIPLRDFSEINPNKFAEIVFGFHGMAIPNIPLLTRILKKGTFSFVMDGMNEVDLERAIHQYTMDLGKNTRSVVSSQLLPKNWKVPVYNLPIPDMNLAKALVTSFLHEKGASTGVEKLVAHPILGSIRSAYECRLISELLIKGQSLPSDRMGLYSAQINEVERIWHSIYQTLYPAVIYEVAWSLWVNNVRRFKPDSRITEENVRLLSDVGIIASRADMFEFTHDLMCAFLSAKFIINNIENRSYIEELFDDKLIWIHSDVELELIFDFLSKMLTEDRSLSFLAAIATKDLSSRKQLLVSITKGAKKRDLELEFV